MLRTWERENSTDWNEIENHRSMNLTLGLVRLLYTTSQCIDRFEQQLHACFGVQSNAALVYLRLYLNPLRRVNWYELTEWSIRFEFISQNDRCQCSSAYMQVQPLGCTYRIYGGVFFCFGFETYLFNFGSLFDFNIGFFYLECTKKFLFYHTPYTRTTCVFSIPFLSLFPLFFDTFTVCTFWEKKNPYRF